MKKIIFILILLVLCVSCSGAPNEEAIQTAIAQTSDAERISQETEVSATKTSIANEPSPTSTIVPTNTPRPTNTKAPTDAQPPTSTPTIEPTIDTSAIIAKNYLASTEDNGVIVEVARILIGEKTAVGNLLGGDFSYFLIFDDKITVVEFIFRIVNNTDKVIKIYFDMKTIASINGEQVVFNDYWLDNRTWFGDDLSSDILPGSTMIGGLYVGIKRSEWNEVSTITISIPEAFEPDNYDDVTNTFLFTIDVLDWTYEEIPEELK
ncbi:MAG: hypothetical protein ACTSQ8_26260 [Candidatus Helarchaeota archaeon]